MELARLRRALPAISALFIAFALVISFPDVAFGQSSPPAATTPSSQSSSAPVEQGKFILHKFEQPIGEETYRIVRNG